MLIEPHNPQETQISNALNALWTIEQGLRAYKISRVYSDYVDIVKQYIKGQRDIINQQPTKKEKE